MKPILTSAEIFALDYWRATNGRTWRNDLLKAWGNHCYGRQEPNHAATLHHLRNRLGPRWLARYQEGS